MTFGIRVLVDLGLDPNKGVSLSSIIRTIPGVEVLGFSCALVNLCRPAVKDVLLSISRYLAWLYLPTVSLLLPPLRSRLSRSNFALIP
jgi:hypothetical protein